MNPVVRLENPTFPMPSFKIIIPIFNPPVCSLNTLLVRVFDIKIAAYSHAEKGRKV